MKVVSFNIRLGLDSSLVRIAEVLQQLGADIACMQEVGCRWVMGEPVDMAEVISQKSGLGHAVFAPAIEKGEARFGIAVVSRFPLKVLVQRPLPRQADEPRVLLVVSAQTDVGELMLATSHVSVVPGDRPAQFEAIAAWIDDLRGTTATPLVLAGDFNAPPDESELGHLVDTLTLTSAVGEKWGRPLPTYPARAPRLAIDHIYISNGLHIADAGVAAMSGSDHHPVWADLFKNAAPLAHDSGRGARG